MLGGKGGKALRRMQHSRGFRTRRGRHTTLIAQVSSDGCRLQRWGQEGIFHADILDPGAGLNELAVPPTSTTAS